MTSMFKGQMLRCSRHKAQIARGRVFRSLFADPREPEGIVLERVLKIFGIALKRTTQEGGLCAFGIISAYRASDRMIVVAKYINCTIFPKLYGV